MTIGFNKAAIMARIEAAETEGLEQTAADVVADARRRAPIRKVFRERVGYKRHFRPLTPLESALATRRAQAYYGANSYNARLAVASIRRRSAPRGRGVELPNHKSNNTLAKSGVLRILGVESRSKNGRKSFTPFIVGVHKKGPGFATGGLGQFLTARGRYEVTSGRAIHREVLASGKVQVRVGGALKASIESEGVIPTADGQKVRVTAGIRYAKFVEFPTRHNAAQPFLRPALQGQRGNLRRNIAGEIRRNLGG